MNAAKPISKFKPLVFLFKSICILITIASISLLAAGSYLTERILAQEAVEIKDSNTQFDIWNFIPGAAGLITGTKTSLKGQDTGRTNILVIGTDPNNGLTDTIMLASYFFDQKKLVTVNIPRDLYVSIPGFATEKINAVYPLARAQKPSDLNYGADFLAKFLASEFDLNIDYWMVTNVDGLRQMVDLVGGVEVDVESSFTDYQFPTDGYTGYVTPAPSFEQGINKMNGIRASIYARSRYGGGSEGSDFSRSRRQSIIIEALLKKIKDQDLASNITKVNSYLNIINKNVRTNMKAEEMLSLADQLKEFDLSSSFLRTIWFSGNGFLCSPVDTGQGYIITYGDSSNCGNILPGNKRDSIYRTQAREFISNILIEGQKDLLNRSSIIVAGNKNPLTNQIFNQLAQAGLSNLTQNNNLKDVVAPGKDTVSKAIGYIPDKEISDLFESIKPEITVELEIKNQPLPDNITLPAGTVSPAILIVVE